MKRREFLKVTGMSLASLSVANTLWAQQVLAKRASLTDLTFTYNSPVYPWTSLELSTLNSWKSDFYPVIKSVFGPPAASKNINVRKDPTITGAAAFYDSSANEIYLKDLLQADPFVHEIHHAFRDDLIITFDQFEEGMVRASEVAVFNKLPQYAYFDRHHSYGIDIYYEGNNQVGISDFAGDFFDGFSNVLMLYQQAGYGWGKCLIEDPQFLVKFNQAYYSAAVKDPSIKNDMSKLSAIAGSIVHTVEGLKFTQWYSMQEIFNGNPPLGYQFVYKRDSSVLYLFNRNQDGNEYMDAGATVNIDVYDCSGNLLSSTTDITNTYGWVGVPIYFPNYQGRLTVSVSADTPQGQVKQDFLTISYGGYSGLFGIVKNGLSGTVTVRTSAGMYSAAVNNGAFDITQAGTVAGKFTIFYQDGKYRHSHTITKDAAPYYVEID